MPLSNFLDRFRPIGAPGPAARTGIPAKDAVGPAAELGPVFAALAREVDRGHARVDEARRQAEQAIEQARTAAEATLARARLGTGTARRAAYDRVLTAAAQDDARVAEASAERAERITQAGRERIASTVAATIEGLLAEAVGE